MKFYETLGAIKEDAVCCSPVLLERLKVLAAEYGRLERELADAQLWPPRPSWSEARAWAFFDGVREAVGAAPSACDVTVLQLVRDCVEDRGRLDKLIDWTDFEGDNGFAVTLEWNNYQDFPMVKDANGKLIGEADFNDGLDGVFEGDGSEADRQVLRNFFRRAIDATPALGDEPSTKA